MASLCGCGATVSVSREGVGQEETMQGWMQLKHAPPLSNGARAHYSRSSTYEVGALQQLGYYHFIDKLL